MVARAADDTQLITATVYLYEALYGGQVETAVIATMFTWLIAACT